MKKQMEFLKELGFDVVESKIVTADNIEGEIPAETYKLTFYEDAKRITINNTVDAYEDLIYQSGDEINYTIDINNKTDADINNVEVTIPLPNGSKVEDTYIESGSNITKDGINIKSDKVIVNISKMPATSTMKIYVKFILGDNLPESFSTKVSLTDGTYTYLSNEKYIYTGKISITAEQVDPVNQYIKEREGFVYSFKIISAPGIFFLSAYAFRLKIARFEWMYLALIPHNKKRITYSFQQK